MRFVVLLLACIWLAACVRQAVDDESRHSAFHLPALSPETVMPSPAYPEVEVSDVEVPPVSRLPLKAATPTLLVNLMVQDAPVQEVLLALARESHLNMDIHPALKGKVSLHAIQQSVPAILSRLAKQVDMYYEWRNGVWSIAPDMPVIRSYRVNYVNMSRDTTGFIGVASEINSTGRAATGRR